MTILKPCQIEPGMFIRRPEAISTSPYAQFREVADTHDVGIYQQWQIRFTDGTYDTWTSDAEFEVQPADERAKDVAVATVYAGLADAYRVPPAAELPDDLTGDDRTHFEDNERRWQVIQGLRNLIRLLDENPHLPTPHSIAVQAGPLSGDPETNRRIVLDAAKALGQPIDRDDDTAISVTAELGEKYGLTVDYTVYAAKPKPAEDGTR